VRDLNRRTENQQQGTAKSKGELPRVPHVIFCLLIVHHSYYNLHHGPGSGRVPQVRQSVPGPKTVFFQCCHSTYQGSRSGPLPFARRVGTVEGAAPHLFRPMYAQATRISCTWLHPATACAAFSKESRMKFANATKLHRKSGGTWGTRPGEWALLMAPRALRPNQIHNSMSDALR